MEDPRAAEGLRFAARVASDPSFAVRRWKVLSGRMAVVCPPGFPLAEILHCTGMLPLHPVDGREILLLEPLADAWIFGAPTDGDRTTAAGKPTFLFGDPRSPAPAESLDRVESLAEWAEELSGEPCSCGALDKSLRAYRERDALLRFMVRRGETSPGVLDPGACRAVESAGRFLPAEVHGILLRRILGDGIPDVTPERKEEGDPFLELSLRLSERRRHP